MEAKVASKDKKDGYRAVIISRTDQKRPPHVDHTGQIVIPPCAHCFYLQEEVQRLRIKLEETRLNSVGIPPTPEDRTTSRRDLAQQATPSSWQNEWANTPDLMSTRRTADSPRLNPGKEMTKETENLTAEINRLKRELLAREAEVRQLRNRGDKITPMVAAKDPWDGSTHLNKPNSTRVGNRGHVTEDVIRPWKVAEMYSALFDVEWQAALYSLTKSGNSEEDGINILQNILMESYEYSRDKASAQLDGITNGSIISNKNQVRPSTKTTPGTSNTQTKNNQYQSTDAITDEAISYRMQIADKTIPYIQESFKKEKLQKNSKLNLMDKAIKDYVDKCVKVTWHMCIQNPRMILENSVKQFSEFDKELYRYYRTPGERYNYVVWPVLMSQNGGKVSAVGVAEAASERVLRNANIIKDK